MVLGVGELLQVTEVVQHEGEALGVPGIAVRPGRVVVDEGDATPALGLPGQHLLGGEDPVAQVRRSFPPRPAQQRPPRRLPHPAQPSAGHHAQRAARRPLDRRRSSLVPQPPPAGAHPLDQELGDGVGRGHAARIVAVGCT